MLARNKRPPLPGRGGRNNLQAVAHRQIPGATQLVVVVRRLIVVVEHVRQLGLYLPARQKGIAGAQIGGGVAAHAASVGRVVVALAGGEEGGADVEKAKLAIDIHTRSEEHTSEL